MFERPTPDMEAEEYLIGKRILAFFVDAVVVGVLAVVPSLIPGLADASASSLAVAIFLFYFIFLEAECGQTVGKNLVGIVVVTEDGNAISYPASIIRTLLRFLDILPFLYILGGIVILLTDRQQRIGDSAADTVVVRVEHRTGQTPFGYKLESTE